MNIDISKYSVGVIVARFQVHDLHEGHHYVIKQVTQNHKKTIIFLGVPRFVGTRNNPLDFDTRKKMIQSEYPDVVIMAIPDQSDNNRWASELDRRIREVYSHGEVLLYGSRDSFIPHYINGGGKFQTKELEPLGTFAGVDIRKMISEDAKNSKDFRSGVIYHSYNLYPHVLTTVDIATLNSDNTKVLLSKKYDESKLRFVGGFVRNTDETMESAAIRIFRKKVGVNSESSDYKYITSCKIPDWRFRGADDGSVMSTFFTCKYLWGSINPGDDISELKWVNISDITETYIESNIMNEHKKLMKIFLEKIKQ